jgi:GNAT superfamily N-acetyltransferase
MWTDLGVKDQAAHEKGDRDYERWARTKLKKHQFFGWIVEDPKKGVVGGGCVWLQTIQPRPHRTATLQPYLLSMYTEPEYRGLGVASMVVNAAIEWCKKNHYERLMLHASEMGRGVYRRLGFKRTWEMRLDLATHGNRKPTQRKKRVIIKTGVH